MAEPFRSRPLAEILADHVVGPPPPAPLRANEHCRHYSYRSTGLRGMMRGDPGGPQCALGLDNAEPGGSAKCMPPPHRDGRSCDGREEYTEAERATWKAYFRQAMERSIVAGSAIPREGSSGEVPCPACGEGTIGWARARINGHLHAACSTPRCFAVIS
ncbi:hypothetical protein [Methylobacterium sp. JK268]